MKRLFSSCDRFTFFFIHKSRWSVSGSYLFNVFLNDLNNQLEGVDILLKYVDDRNIVFPLWKDGVDQSPQVVGNFFRWSEKRTSCHVIQESGNEELTMRKKRVVEELSNT